MTTETEVQVATRTLGEISSAIAEDRETNQKTFAELKERNEKMAEDMAEAQKTIKDFKRERLTKSAESDGIRLRGVGAYEGLSVLDFGLVRRFAHSQRRESYGPAWVNKTQQVYQSMVEQVTPDMVDAHFDMIDRTMRDHFNGRSAVDRQQQRLIRATFNSWRDVAMRAALDSTTAGSGDELVPTLEAAELWMDVNLETMIQGLIPVFPMPSNPFDIPRQLGDVNFYPGTENVATTSSAPSTGKTTLTAYEIVGQPTFSFSLEEDSVLASLSGEIRTSLVRNIAEVLDDIILNADTTTTNNINADGATISTSDAGKAQWLIGYDGLRHLPLVDNTAMGRDDTGTVDEASYSAIRALMEKYGVRPSELVYVQDVVSYIEAQTNVTQIQTLDKYGPQATILTGELGRIYGVPIIVSEQMRQTDDDGLMTDPEGAAGNDNGSILLFNRTQWAQGFRRELTIDVERDTQKRQTVMTASFRHALNERSGTKSSSKAAAMSYNIT